MQHIHEFKYLNEGFQQVPIVVTGGVSYKLFLNNTDIIEIPKSLSSEGGSMSLDVETPAPPALDRPQDPGDYDAVVEPEDRVDDTPPHEALATFLQEGAWEAGFNEWRDHTYMTEDEFQLVQERGLIDEFDFYWNVATEDVGYRAPAVSDDFSGSDNTLERGEIQGIEEELDELGRTVSEVLETDYIHRSGEEFGFFGDY